MTVSLLTWIGLYGAITLFWIWIIFWNGAERLEGTLASGFLVDWFAPRWSADGIRLFAWLSLILSSIVFVLGLFVPELRIA